MKNALLGLGISLMPIAHMINRYVVSVPDWLMIGFTLISIASFTVHYIKYRGRNK